MGRPGRRGDRLRPLRVGEPVILRCDGCGKRLALPGEVWLIGHGHTLCPLHVARGPGNALLSAASATILTAKNE
jgi:hypothetical protein